nr:hypothetical protein [Picrophilus oshimae]
MNKNNLHQPMKYYDARKLLLNLKERTGIEKRIYPHLFRHTRASILASKLIENVRLKGPELLNKFRNEIK